MLDSNPILISLKKHIFLEIKSLLLLLGISIISSSLVIIQPLLMQKLIDEAFVLKDLNKLYIWATCILSLGLLSIIFSSYNQYKYTEISTKILFNFRQDIFKMIFSHPKIFFLKFKTGDLLLRLQSDISDLQRFATDSLFALLSSLLGIIGALVIMFSFNPLFAFLSLILLPLEFFILKPMYPIMENKISLLKQSSANLGSFIIESLRYAIFFKITNSINLRAKKMSKTQDENRQKILNLQKLQILFTQIPVLIALLGRAFLVFYGGVLVVKGHMQIGEFIAFLTYFGMILAPIQTFLGIINNIPKAKVSLERLFVFVPQANINYTYKDINQPSIEFENLSFEYNCKVKIFEQINFKIKYGEKIIIKGENGAGKTTLFELLLKLHKPTSGNIKISNINLDEISPQILYSKVALVEQEPTILAASIEDNLKLAKQNASESELFEVIQKVGLLAWLKQMPLSLKTQISEQNLSVGQKQRISIARILLKNPCIILLDEFTASLDEPFSCQIENLIDEFFKDKTRIIISHKKEHKNAKIFKIYDKKLIQDLQNE